MGWSSAIFGIILISGLAQCDVIGARNIQKVQRQLVFDDISCYTCEGSSCAVSDPRMLPVQECHQFGSQCVTTFNEDGSVAARGCSNMLTTEAKETCASSLGKWCFKCASSLCNVAKSTRDIVECYQCDSYTNSECVWNPDDASIPIVQCADRCVVALLPTSATDKTTYETYRGCEGDVGALGVNSCTPSQSCWSCAAAKCNGFNEPASRLSCNFCETAECETTISRVCPSYRADDKCAYVLNKDASISFLTCTSNFDSTSLDYMRALGLLVECSGSNCNTLAAGPPLQSKSNICMACSSYEEEICATDPTKINKTSTCSDLNQHCATRITGDGRTIRGCLAEQPKDDVLMCHTGSNETYCATCNETSCNNQIFPENRLSCYICNSEDDSSCTAKPTKSSVCSIYSPTETCTQYLKDGITYRGCSSQFPCTGNSCLTCNTSGCNNKDLTGGSATIQLTGALLFASLLVFVYQGLGL